jgi:hypothetical protein
MGTPSDCSLLARVLLGWGLDRFLLSLVVVLRCEKDGSKTCNDYQPEQQWIPPLRCEMTNKRAGKNKCSGKNDDSVRDKQGCAAMSDAGN